MFYIMSLNLGSMWSNNNYNKSNIKFVPPKKRQPNKTNLISTYPSSKKKHSRAFWGNATWILFHTIAAKINTNFYKTNYLFVWKFIKECCGNLPCPYCRTHAMSYINKVKINQINTKKKLQRMLFNFHNTANTHAHNPQYEWGNINIYNKANVKNVFKNFENKFFISFYGGREFSQWLRNNFKKNYYSFIKRIINHMNT